MAQRTHRRVLALTLVLFAVFLAASPAFAQTPPTTQPAPPPPASAPGTQADPDPDALKVRFGLEYWVRASNINDFDFDSAQDDQYNFAWQRIKPFFGLRKRWFELVLQGQDARSYNVP